MASIRTGHLVRAEVPCGRLHALADRYASMTSRPRPGSFPTLASAILGLLQEPDHLFAGDGREAGQELMDRVAGFQVVEQGLDRDPRASEDRSPPPSRRGCV